MPVTFSAVSAIGEPLGQPVLILAAIYLECKNVKGDRTILSFKDGNESCQYFIHDSRRYAFQFASITRGKIESARLVASDNARCMCAGPGQGYSKAGCACKAASTCDWQHDGCSGQSIESERRHD